MMQRKEERAYKIRQKNVELVLQVSRERSSTVEQRLERELRLDRNVPEQKIDNLLLMVEQLRQTLAHRQRTAHERLEVRSQVELVPSQNLFRIFSITKVRKRDMHSTHLRKEVARHGEVIGQRASNVCRSVQDIGINQLQSLGERFEAVRLLRLGLIFGCGFRHLLQGQIFGATRSKEAIWVNRARNGLRVTTCLQKRL